MTNPHSRRKKGFKFPGRQAHKTKKTKATFPILRAEGPYKKGGVCLQQIPRLYFTLSYLNMD